MDTTVTQQYLESQGWKRDKNCPDGVNRWTNQPESFNHFQGGCHASVTFKDASGTSVDYAVINHFTAPHGYIHAHRSVKSIEGGHVTTTEFLEQEMVEGDLTVEELNTLMEIK